MDFMYDAPYYGKAANALSSIGESSQKIFVIEIDTGLPSGRPSADRCISMRSKG